MIHQIYNNPNRAFYCNICHNYTYTNDEGIIRYDMYYLRNIVSCDECGQDAFEVSFKEHSFVYRID